MIAALEPQHASGCDAVLRSLPYHFGDPEGQRECHEAVRTSEGFVALDGDDVSGFITFDMHGADSAEVTWLAVRQDVRRTGIGGRLIEHTAGHLHARGVRLLAVLTLAESVPEEGRAIDNYADTRRFYRAHGFQGVREFDLRGFPFPMLLLVRRL